MVHECLKAADELAKQGRKATVIDAYSLPLNVQGVLDVAARSGGRIVTVEDNYPGGLDAEIGTAIAGGEDEITLVPLTVKRIPKSGREPEQVLEYVGLGMKEIMEAAR
jgi:transketolase